MTNHLDHTTRALISTVRASLIALRAATNDMRDGGGPAALKRAIEESDVLSGAVSRLDKLIDTLADAPPPPAAVVAPAVDLADLRAVLNRVAAKAQGSVCAQCGGVQIDAD